MLGFEFCIPVFCLSLERGEFGNSKKWRMFRILNCKIQLPELIIDLCWNACLFDTFRDPFQFFFA